MTRTLGICLAIALTFPVATALAQASEAQAEERVSVSRQMLRADRDAGADGVVTEDRFRPLRKTSEGTKSQRPAAKSTTGTASSAPNVDFWFYDADVVLFNDHDRDGHFHGIDLLFDADTIYSYAEVYAVAYLSLEGGPWNEYAATDVFALTGTVADDEYVIVTELVDGYPTGSYDLLIELFDADTNAFVASYGPTDTSALAFLALEDSILDTPHESTTVIVNERGGGSLGWAGLLVLAAWPAVRRRWPV